jgi:enamine deaminase RidA (YjgF/YER057c/UK114 family)
MSEIGRRIEQLGIELPVRNRGDVLDAVIHSNLMFLSAHLPVDINGDPVYVGKIEADLTVEEGYKAARLCGINMLTTIKDYIGELDRVDYFIKVLGLVNSSGDFSRQPDVVNGFSDLMVEIFGKRGQHARSAMGAFALPKNVPVIVEALIKIRD